MAFNKESNTYIISFSVIMVLVVGTLLAIVATGLKPLQKENLKNEKMQYILNSCLIEADRAGAGGMFNDYVTNRVVIDFNGNVKSENSGDVDPLNKEDAFNVDVIKEYKKKDLKPEDKNYPFYVCEKDGQKFYVVPVAGKGLWDLIWGYICIEEDGSTIYGTVFDHKAETPGLGSKITEDFFEQAFIGKSIEKSGSFSKIKVVKPGKELDNQMVDGISGGTFTSVGVQEMMDRTLKIYYDYFKKNK